MQLGCAYAAAGELAQAKTTLLQAVVVGGEFDHPLTSTALVELGRLSLETGDFSAARDYFQEATFACVNYPNPAVLEEAFRLGLLAHLLLNQKEPYPGVARAADWATGEQLPPHARLVAAVGGRELARAGRYRPGNGVVEHRSQL